MSSSANSSGALSDSTNNKKRSGTDDILGNPNKKPAAKTPYEEYFAELKKFQSDNGYMGQLLLKGIPPRNRNDDDEEDNDEGNDDDQEEEDKSKYTKEEMEILRFILINQSRADQLEIIEKLVLGDQAGQCFMMFDTSFSYGVMNSWEDVKKLVNSRSKSMTLPKKLDILFAFTHTILNHDVWMHDNEGDMGTLVKGLASAWKRLLSKNSDEDLGLDSAYTKPGIMELLKQFQQAIDQTDSCMEMGKFKYM